MKKITLLLILFNAFAFGQISQDSLEIIAKKYFEDNYVQKVFKDPYSYELKKIWSKPILLGYRLNSEIESLEYSVKSNLYSKSERKVFSEKLKTLKEKQASMSENDKNKIATYTVYFDTYGANSYGNKVLSKYALSIKTDGTVDGNVMNIN